MESETGLIAKVKQAAIDNSERNSKVKQAIITKARTSD
jgi:hypothetical protein